VICIQQFTDNFKLTADDAGAQICPAGGIVMKTWNDSVEYQMLFDALKFNNNSKVG
jgi:hypothetical protein